MNTVYLLLGSNLGERADMMQMAKTFVEAEIGQLQTESSIYKTEPWQMHDAPWFLNQVLSLDTSLSAKDVIEKTKGIEIKLGRNPIHTDAYESRSIDIDLLYYNDSVIKDEGLIVPHPKLHDRKFTLIPLVEVAASFIHPRLNLSNKELLEKCNDDCQVEVLL